MLVVEVVVVDRPLVLIVGASAAAAAAVTEAPLEEEEDDDDEEEDGSKERRKDPIEGAQEEGLRLAITVSLTAKGSPTTDCAAADTVAAATGVHRQCVSIKVKCGSLYCCCCCCCCCLLVRCTGTYG